VPKHTNFIGFILFLGTTELFAVTVPDAPAFVPVAARLEAGRLTGHGSPRSKVNASDSGSPVSPQAGHFCTGSNVTVEHASQMNSRSSVIGSASGVIGAGRHRVPGRRAVQRSVRDFHSLAVSRLACFRTSATEATRTHCQYSGVRSFFERDPSTSDKSERLPSARLIGLSY